MKECSKRIKALIRADLIMMNGGKNGLKTVMLLFLGIITLITVFVVPLMAIYAPLIVGIMLVSMMTRNEIKFHGTKTYFIVPIERKDLVLSRYILTVGSFTVIAVLFYALMMISMKLHFYNEEFDNFFSIVVSYSGDAFTMDSYFTLGYVMFSSVGLFTMTSMLHRYFKMKDYEKLNKLTFDKKRLKRDALYAAGTVAAVAVIAAMWTGLIPLQGLLYFFLQLIVQLLQAAGGRLFSIMCIIMSTFNVIFCYVSSAAEYETRDL